MLARWLGLPNARGMWVFTLSALTILVLLFLAARGTKAHRPDFLFAAGLAGYAGASLLQRSWRRLTSSLPDIYNETLRTGHRMPTAEKLLRLLCIGLIAMAFYVQFAG